jgi:glyoxylase-like metal-dependent hydrolase (beta-lactamase superfamily II)
MTRIKVVFGLLLSLSLGLASAAHAFELKAEPVADGVYALVGPTGPRTYENYGLNANFGVVVTNNGVALIDSGASAQSARVIEAAVRHITEAPIRWVINTGSQDHRWLGNGYFAGKGAEVIALAATAKTQRAFAEEHLNTLKGVLRERLAGTRPYQASKPVDGDRTELNLGGRRLVLARLGDAHFDGDAVVWLPEERVLFGGDLIYVNRMLGILPHSDVYAWRETFHATFAAFSPRRVVPGHGSVCSPEVAQRDTGDYLDWLITEVGAAVDEWAPLDETVTRLNKATPAPFRHLQHFDNWNRTNLNRTYVQLQAR